MDLDDATLKREMKKYRLLSLAPLLAGLALTLALIWLDQEGRPWGLLYFALIIVLLPVIIKSGKLHREWRRRHG